MAQHSFNIPNQSGALFRANLNNALAALATCSSGNTEPEVTYSFMIWIDTSGDSPILKVRNFANNGWISIGRPDLPGFGISSIINNAIAPTAPLVNTFWIDTSGDYPVLKLRNSANDAWISLGRLDQNNFGYMDKSGGVFSGAIDFSNNDFIKIPGGTTVQRPAEPTSRMIRFNTSLNLFEGYTGAAWESLGGAEFKFLPNETVVIDGEIELDLIAKKQFKIIQGNGEPVVSNLKPFGEIDYFNGTEITLMGLSDDESVILKSNDVDYGIVGTFSEIELTKYKSVSFVYLALLKRWILKG